MKAEWDPKAALSALLSGHGTVEFLGPIDPGKEWVDAYGRGTISVEAQRVLASATTAWAVPQSALPTALGDGERHALVALAFIAGPNEISFQPGIRDPSVALGIEPSEPARLIIAGKKRGDGEDGDGDGDGDADAVDNDFEATSSAPDTGADDQWEVDEKPSSDEEADLWEPTQDETPDPQSENDPDPYVVEVDTDEELMDKIEDAANERDKKKMN